MGKGRERQIILKTDQRTLLLELGLGGKFQAHQADGTSAESFSKAMFLKLQYTMVDLLTHIQAGPRPAPRPAQHYFPTEE
jgi:hypothetical protein